MCAQFLLLFLAIAHHPILFFFTVVTHYQTERFIFFCAIQFHLLCVLRGGVQKGDALITTCYYDTRGYTNTTLGGFSISDEMCVNYIQYYPATKLEVCKSSVSEKTLEDYFFYMKRYVLILSYILSFMSVCSSVNEINRLEEKKL